MQPDITVIASLIGEPARARMMTALMSGKALTATELSLEAEVTPQTASSHLNKLTDKGLLVVRKQGRHRYFQLASLEVAELIESLLNISAMTPSAVTGPSDPDLRSARICYDHLAGELGVSLYDALVSRQLIEDHGCTTRLTAAGEEFFKELGIDLNGLQRKRRSLCKSCLDWSERRNHLAGALGAWIMKDMLENRWAAQQPDSRIIRFNPSGIKAFRARYGL